MTVTVDLPSPTYPGTGALTKITFTNPGSPRPVDPTTVTLEILDGNGSLTTWVYQSTGSIVRMKQGLYLAEYLLDVPGNWSFKWIGTGACAVPEVATFTVDPLPF